MVMVEKTSYPQPAAQGQCVRFSADSRSLGDDLAALLTDPLWREQG